MFFRKSKRKTEYKKRGFTLAESVLALAVISITSVGTLSLVLSSQRATISAAQKQQAQLYATDIINCYRVEGTFERNVEFALGLPANSWTADWTDNEETLTLNKDMKAIVTIAGQNITVSVQTFDGKEITSAEFTKGGRHETDFEK